MTPFGKLILPAYQLLAVIVIFLFLQGCACNDDSCNYKPGTIAVWSDDNKKMAVIVTDFGDDIKKKDNKHSIFTLNADGSGVAHLYELENDKSVFYYSLIHNYMLLTNTSILNNNFLEYYRLDLNNNNLETIYINETPCFERKILPSKDGSIWAKVDISAESTPLVRGDGEFTVGCKNLTMKVSHVSAIDNEEIASFTEPNLLVGYNVSFPEKAISAKINMYWSDKGLIIETNSQDKIYSIFNLDGTTAAYEFPKNCYPLATSSSIISKNNIEAKAFIVLDNGMYNQDARVELTDLSTKTKENYAWNANVPSVGQEICVL